MPTALGTEQIHMAEPAEAKKIAAARKKGGI